MQIPLDPLLLLFFGVLWNILQQCSRMLGFEGPFTFVRKATLGKNSVLGFRVSKLLQTKE
jgi:hypothetical protein